MILAILLAIYAIILISALIYIASIACTKHDRKVREQYQEHIDNLVEELFPPTIPTVNTSPEVQTAIDQLQTINEDLEYQEAKRDMVANIRTYFNRRKNNAKMPGPDELSPVNPFSKQSLPPLLHPSRGYSNDPSYPYEDISDMRISVMRTSPI